MTRVFAASFHVFQLSRLISMDKTVLQIGEEKYEIDGKIVVDGIEVSGFGEFLKNRKNRMLGADSKQ